MSYSKCGLCLQDLEVIKPSSGIPYIRCLNWRECPFFCREDNVHGYQQCINDHVISAYKVREGGKQLCCKHVEVSTLRVSGSEKNPFRPYFMCRQKEKCQFFQWGDELPADVFGPPVYKPRETEANVVIKNQDKIKRPTLQRQFSRMDQSKCQRSLGQLIADGL